MPLLFSYGTLQQETVQTSTFGRRLTGRRDVLHGFEPARVPIENALVVQATGLTHHANARYTGRAADQVDGMVFEVTDEELAAADQYEAPAQYEKVFVTLASGARAWVYVHAAADGR
jgi:gamma-glutamylcyclotransferase (GGCT)/AIG2-like uncharacterized protein YtfP